MILCIFVFLHTYTYNLCLVVFFFFFCCVLSVVGTLQDKIGFYLLLICLFERPKRLELWTNHQLITCIMVYLSLVFVALATIRQYNSLFSPQEEIHPLDNFCPSRNLHHGNRVTPTFAMYDSFLSLDLMLDNIKSMEFVWQLCHVATGRKTHNAQ